MLPISEEIKKGIACDSVGEPDSVVGRTVCVLAHPGKMAIFPFLKWFEKRYLGRYHFARLVFSFDLFLVGLVVGLGLIGIIFTLYKPVDFSDNILFEATVAPREVVSGAPSTLIIRYTNGTGEELRNARLTMGFPAYFELQEIASPDGTVENHAVMIGTLAPGASGSVRVRGVMFGDVGGKQTFRSILTFTHGEREKVGQKISFHTFSPARSTLALDVELPERLIAFQPVVGTITYRNTGEINFPEISIEPHWPTGFILTKSGKPLKNNVFQLPAISAGASGTLTFEGVLGDSGKEVRFVFSPSFTFGETRYAQEDLVYTREVIPPPLKVNHSLDQETLRPGGNVTITISYENTGAYSLKNVAMGFETDSPFFRTRQHTVNTSSHPELASIAPGATGTLTVTAPLRSSILQSETTEYENIRIRTRAIGIYRLPDPETGSLKNAPLVTSRGSEIATTLVTPFVLESFARYTTPSGDQLGRGPLPPLVGLETKYWIFWNIRGTTNRIQNVRLEGELGPNVRFTGRQTVSVNKGVIFDPTTRTIVWTTDAIDPTLSPESKIIGVAFEVGVTPTESQVGSIPSLLTDITATGLDAVTGAFVSATGTNVTTSLPNDARAAGKAVVEP